MLALKRNLLFPLAKGVATYIPFLYRARSGKTGGTNSARYCYSVWLRHLTMAFKCGMATLPNVVAELGPGDSLGIGLAALLSGANTYYALDMVGYANKERNLQILDELIELFKNRERLPDEREYPNVRPCLDSYEFPVYILSDITLERSLQRTRIEAIRKVMLDPKNSEREGIKISYIVPWNTSKAIKETSVDLIYSQAVLEHVEDLAETYRTLHRCLKFNGYMSHEIDFKCHGIAKDWNFHWTYGDLAWRLLVGRRPYLLNRMPHSVHIELLNKCGFEILCDIRGYSRSAINRRQLASRFSNLTDDDLTTTDSFILSRKRGETP